MRIKTLRLSSLLLVQIVFCNSTLYAETLKAEYQKWQAYSTSTVLQYPDFDLRFKGEEPGPLYPGSTTHRLSPKFTFEATKNNSKVEVVWSSGTGDIGPTDFSIEGKTFFLEKSLSGVLSGFVSGDKVMVTPEAAWMAESEKRRIESNKKNSD